MNYSKLNTLIEFITKPDIYWQISAIIVCFIIAYVFNKLTRRLLYLKVKNDREFGTSNLNKIIIRYVSPLFATILLIIALSTGMSIFDKFYETLFLFSALIKISALFLVLKLIKVFFANNFIANLALAFLAPVVLLSIFGFLEPTISYLDSLSFSMGKFRISIYTVIKASLTLIMVFWISGIVSRKSKSYVKSNQQIKISTKGVINKVIDLVIYFIVFVILLRVLGVDTTTFAVVGGAIGVGIGLGLQKIASNFIGGIILLFEKSVEIGDLVEIDGAIEGIITHFGGRYTLLETFDGKEVMVPNEDLIINKVVNSTYNNDRGRIEFDIRVSYGSDINKVMDIMVKAAKEHPKCLLYPTPEVYVTNFGESAIELIMHFWINNVSDGKLRPKSDVMVSVLKKFTKNKINIPLPQSDINLKTRHC